MSDLRKSKPIGVLTKTFRLLDLLRNAAAPLSLKEISASTGMNKSTVFRILSHLEQERYLSRNTSAGYTVGPRLWHVGGHSSFQLALHGLVRPYLWELWRATEETVNLGVLDGLDIVYLDALESPRRYRLAATIGSRVVIYASALGKCILSFLPAERREIILNSLILQPLTPKTICSQESLRSELEAVRTRGWAVDDEETIPGVRCAGSPVLDAKQQVVAALSISGPTTRISVELLPSFAAAVKQTAEMISMKLASLEAPPESPQAQGVTKAH